MIDETLAAGEWDSSPFPDSLPTWWPFQQTSCTLVPRVVYEGVTIDDDQVTNAHGCVCRFPIAGRYECYLAYRANCLSNTFRLLAMHAESTAAIFGAAGQQFHPLLTFDYHISSLGTLSSKSTWLKCIGQCTTDLRLSQRYLKNFRTHPDRSIDRNERKFLI